MINTKIIEDIITTALWTPYVDGEDAQSLLLLAEVEGGKTSLTSQFRKNYGIAFIHDATAYGILTEYQQQLLQGDIKHFIFPEFILPLSRKQETSSGFLAFLNGLTEEGIQEIQTYAQQIKLPKPLKAGVIACLAKSEFVWRKSYWTKTGFLSRFLPVSYSYSQKVEVAIFEAIFSGKKDVKDISLNFSQGKVTLPEDIARKLKPIAKQLASGMGIKGQVELAGFRSQQQLQRMIKALALSNGKAIVDDTDFYKIMEMSTYMNYDFPQI
jgi:hypothetical protein